MDPIDLSTAVHRALALELIAKAPPAILDDLVASLCERIRAVDETEVGHPSQVERAARVLGVFERSVHLAPIVYDALGSNQLRALVVLALDRFAIDAAPADAAVVVTAAERYVRAVREPAITHVVRPRVS